MPTALRLWPTKLYLEKVLGVRYDGDTFMVLVGSRGEGSVDGHCGAIAQEEVSDEPGRREVRRDGARVGGGVTVDVRDRHVTALVVDVVGAVRRGAAGAAAAGILGGGGHEAPLPSTTLVQP